MMWGWAKRWKTPFWRRGRRPGWFRRCRRVLSLFPACVVIWFFSAIPCSKLFCGLSSVVLSKCFCIFHIWGSRLYRMFPFFLWSNRGCIPHEHMRWCQNISRGWWGVWILRSRSCTLSLKLQGSQWSFTSSLIWCRLSSPLIILL